MHCRDISDDDDDNDNDNDNNDDDDVHNEKNASANDKAKRYNGTHDDDEQMCRLGQEHRRKGQHWTAANGRLWKTSMGTTRGCLCGELGVAVAATFSTTTQSSLGCIVLCRMVLCCVNSRLLLGVGCVDDQILLFSLAASCERDHEATDTGEACFCLGSSLKTACC